MLLDQVFPLECIKVGLEGETKDELFRELVEVFAASRKDEVDRAELLRAINEREALMSTGIKRGIAIPHGKSSTLSGIHGVLGVTLKGIEYGSFDGVPVNLVFLLLSSKNESERHLRVLKSLAILLESESFQNELLSVRDAAQAFEIIHRYEIERLGSQE
jgi:nitrogen PTS system EIIA component